MKNLAAHARVFLRLTIALLFGYFGYFAVTEPQVQALMWIRPEFQGIITMVMTLATFMIILGSVQLIVALAFISGKYLKLASIVAIALLLGIIVNLGFNDVALRDLVIMAAIAYLASEQQER